MSASDGGDAGLRPFPITEIGRIDLPHGADPGYDHADVHAPTGRTFVANTELGQVEVLDGVSLTHVATVPDCPEASGVLVAEDHVLGAARGSGELLVLDALTSSLVRRFEVGTAPNGLAWDGSRRRVLVADVLDLYARVFDLDGKATAQRELPGRPRWCAYLAARDAYLVNIREPPVVELLRGEDLAPLAAFSVDARGPHGLGRDPRTDTALVACDDATLQWLDLGSGSVIDVSALSGAPDVLWVDATRRAAYVSVGDPGTIHVFDLDSWRELARVPTGPGAHTSSLDEGRGILVAYLPDPGHAVAFQLPT